MTLKEVIARNEALVKLAQKALPVKLGYAIAKNAQNLESEIKLIEAARIKLIEQYAERDESGQFVIEGNSYKLGDNLTAYVKEYEEYLNSEIKIDIHKISVNELDKLEDSRYDTLTASDIASINFMLEE